MDDVRLDNMNVLELIPSVQRTSDISLRWRVHKTQLSRDVIAFFGIRKVVPGKL